MTNRERFIAVSEECLELIAQLGTSTPEEEKAQRERIEIARNGKAEIDYAFVLTVEAQREHLRHILAHKQSPRSPGNTEKADRFLDEILLLMKRQRDRESAAGRLGAALASTITITAVEHQRALLTGADVPTDMEVKELEAQLAILQEAVSRVTAGMN